MAAETGHVAAEGSEEGQVHRQGSAAGCRGRCYLFFYGVAQETGRGQDVIEGVVRRLMVDGEGFAQRSQFMVDKIGIEAAVYVQRVVIGEVTAFGHVQALELAVQDGQVIRDVVADDDGISGKVQKGRQGFFRIPAFGG